MGAHENEDKKPKYWSVDEATINIQRYCAYQERCHSEVRSKLLDHGIYGDLLEEIISDLISNNFLDEERFARTFVRGKFRIKNWGRNKILSDLKLKKVSPYCIKLGLEEIDEDEYFQTLLKLLTKKDNMTKFVNGFDRLKKLSDFALQKGYEYSIIKDVLAILIVKK